MCLQPGDILRQRYQIVSELGRGGFARTYIATDLDIPDNRLCVVKEIKQPSNSQLLPEARDRFEREVQALYLLGRHPQIPQLFESFEDNEKFYLIQEYIEGRSLREQFNQNPQWNETQVIDFLQDILPVIAFVHQNNVIHRDITPSNLIRRDCDGRIVLIDFGAVKEISSLEITDSGETRSRTIYTEGYAPAEQLKGHPRRCSDIYAVGIIAIEGLTGLHPAKDFLIDSGQGDIVWRYSTPDRPMVQISGDMETILNKMVRYYFTNRYQSAPEVLQDLNSIATLQPPPPQHLEHNPPVSGPSPPERNRFSRSHFRLLLLGIAGIMAGIAIGLFLHNTLTPKTCLFVQGDALSCGEESILKSSNPRLKQSGLNEFAKHNYREAFNFFKRSWIEEEQKDPETLIYMNNALLKATKVEHYTIAIIVPVGINEQGRAEIDLAKQILRGVAQAQTEVNLKLFNADLERNLKGLEFQENQAIKGKGLQVIIADDANLKEEAIARANSLVKLTGILGAIGHYTNPTTAHTVDIYNQNHLVLISPGSTTEVVTEKRRNFFFRTVPSTKVSVEVFTKYLSEKQGQTKIAGFYNSRSESISTFWEEFRKQFRERGGTIANITEFDLSKSDFDVKKAIKEVGETEKITIVLNPSHVPLSVNNAMALFQANLDRNWVVGTGGIYGQKTLEAASQLPSYDKFAAAVSWHPLNSPNRKFIEDTRKLWKGDVSHRTALTYDAAKTLIQAIEMQPQPSREGMQTTMADPNFSATGATGTIQFDTMGERKNFSPKLVHIVKCSQQQFGVTFVPIEFPTATAAGLKCD
ncbi:bifunctional serine/threonine-protein kinase/ABC transporter substrate-binding protein [Microcoleus sp. bin38.metabat.b11b12b14.051]|uniref:bifunctional serine/threonine-protein kinase/ABC transporter substrate-binding protein n=1 Tax=Microcoleus sp. bin38.metabat.b11b12b14.051 TaxID=2742709 RepID=UPI0025E8AE8F|nr:bifunctional serine/threonine-protein kinase/ABC transporter substrate-binding protein [Microcoleus sp. bin38.metabat.b11b12b14.051]